MIDDAEPTYDDRISARVRTFRKLRGLSQTDVARAVGIAQDNYSRYERSERRRGWPVWLLADVADALQVPFVALIPGERVVCQSCGGTSGPLAHARLPASDDEELR